MRRLVALIAASAAIAGLAGGLTSTASAFGPCSQPTTWQNLETGFYVAIHGDQSNIVSADQGSFWGAPEVFQSCLTGGWDYADGGPRIAIYSDSSHLWVGNYFGPGWSGLYAVDGSISERDEYTIPEWAQDEYAFSFYWANRGVQYPILTAAPFYVKPEPGFYHGYFTFNYGWLGCPGC